MADKNWKPIYDIIGIIILLIVMIAAIYGSLRAKAHIYTDSVMEKLEVLERKIDVIEKKIDAAHNIIGPLQAPMPLPEPDPREIVPERIF